MGAIQHHMAQESVNKICSVDISPHYLEVSRLEAMAQGYIDSVEYIQGDFVTLASGIEPADIVTLDRVVCCYHDVESLVLLSASKAKMLYGLVLPKGNWLTRLVARVENIYLRMRGSGFRVFIHSIEQITAIVKEEGFDDPIMKNAGIGWEVAIYLKK